MKKRFFSFIAIVSICCVLCVSMPFSAYAQDDFASSAIINDFVGAGNLVPGEICVIFKSSSAVNLNSSKDLSDTLGIDITSFDVMFDSARRTETTLSSTVDTSKNDTTARKATSVLTLKIADHSQSSVNAAITQLNKRDDVLVAFQNSYYEIEPMTYSTTSSTNNLDWNRTETGFDTAYDCGFANADSVTIAVLSSGCDSDSDLEENVVWNLAYNVYENNNDVTDTNGMGSSTIRLLAADYDDGVGMDGLLQSANVIPVKITIGEGSWVSGATIAGGITYANDCGADIICFPSDFSIYDKTAEVVSAYLEFDGLVITNAGEDADGVSMDIEDSIYDDGKINLPSNWIVVGMGGENRTVAPGAFYNDTYVDLFAPGYEVWFGNSDGTSGNYGTDSEIAAAHVTAACALLMHKATHKTPLQIKQLLLDNVTEVAVMESLCVSGGYLNLQNAVDALFAEIRAAYSKGDVNGDGLITTADYELCKSIFMGTEIATQQQLNAADVAGSAGIDRYDYIAIQRHCNKTLYIAPY